MVWIMYLYSTPGNRVRFDNQIFDRSLVTMSRDRGGIGEGMRRLVNLVGEEELEQRFDYWLD